MCRSCSGWWPENRKPARRGQAQTRGGLAPVSRRQFFAFFTRLGGCRRRLQPGAIQPRMRTVAKYRGHNAFVYCRFSLSVVLSGIFLTQCCTFRNSTTRSGLPHSSRPFPASSPGAFKHLGAGALRLTASGGGFNRSMQHTNHRIGGRSVTNEAATQNLLFGQPEGADVGALEARLDVA